MSKKSAAWSSKRSFAFLIFCALLGIAGLLGCSSNQGQKTYSAKAEAHPSPWKMQLSTEPAQPKYGAETMFRVTMKDEAGNPVSGAKVDADLKMKSHDMGRNVVPLADNGQGIYEGRGRLTMAGPWDVVIIASKDGKGGMQTFNVVARRE